MGGRRVTICNIKTQNSYKELWKASCREEEEEEEEEEKEKEEEEEEQQQQQQQDKCYNNVTS